MSIYHDLMSNDYIELARQFRVNPQHCDNPEHYQNYIWQDSIIDQKQGMGVTHIKLATPPWRYRNLQLILIMKDGIWELIW